MQLTENQQKAYDAMVSGKNVFLTGEAGTGKSFVINAFLEANKDKNILVTAPTGIAAINVHGSTLHRVFGAPTHPIITNVIKKVPDEVKAADIIIIDEISMCRVDLFDFVARNIRKAEQEENKKIQLIVIGDFFQLPPVTKKEDKELLKVIYPISKQFFAFESDYWDVFGFKTIYLKDIIRQNDVEFISELNKARVGDKSCIDFFNQYQKEEIPGGIVLCGTNKTVLDINTEKLAEIDEKEMISTALYIGNFKETDCLADKELSLKKGARVMALVNHPKGHYQNGTLGTVVSAENGIAIVKFDNGYFEEIEPHTWEKEEYDVVNDFDNNGDLHRRLIKHVVGSCTQLPLKLAYAITIHKSQGQTFDKVNLIPKCFNSGQLYVALSRVTTLNGFSLLEPIYPSYLKSDEKVVRFYNCINEFSNPPLK